MHFSACTHHRTSVTAAAAVKQSDVSTSRSRKNIRFNTSSVRSSSARPARRPPDKPRGRPADRGVEERRRATWRSTPHIANPEIIEFDGREISAATSCLRRVRRRNGATDDEDHQNNCPPVCRRTSIITAVAVHKLLPVEWHKMISVIISSQPIDMNYIFCCTI